MNQLVPFTLAVGGGSVPSLFRLGVLYLGQRPGMGGQNIPPSELVIKPGRGRSEWSAGMAGWGCDTVVHETCYCVVLKPVKKR